MSTDNIPITARDIFGPVPDEDMEPTRGQKKKSQATKLVELVLNCPAITLFHTRDGEPYAAVQVDGHTETMQTKSKCFRKHVSRLFYALEGSAPNGQAVRDALAVIDGKATFEGPEQDVFVRLAEHGGYIWIDLADARWRAVRVGPAGWEIVENPPVRFRRPKDMGELPEPLSDGNVDELLSFVNVEPTDFILVLAWLVAALRPRGPYTILYILGEQGSAKSTTCRVLRKLVDPAKAELRTTPRDERDLAIAANNAQVLTIDNISKLEPWLSDALCRIVTGGGLSTRELYTDAEEVVFDNQRPILLNGIEELNVRGDFLDRSIMVTCPVISESQRQDEAAFWERFEAARPRLLGALLDKVAGAMKNLPNVTLARKPRMADFAMWSVAGLGSAFMSAYEDTIAGAVNVVLEASVIVPYLRDLAGLNATWTTKELLERITKSASDSDLKQWGWPKTPEKLAGQLRRLAPALRREGVRWEKLARSGKEGKRAYGLSRVCHEPSAPSEPSARPSEPSAELSVSNSLKIRPADSADSSDSLPLTSEDSPATGARAWELIESVHNLALEHGSIGVSMLKESLGVPTAEAIRLLDALEAAGIVGPAHGSGKRRVKLIRGDM